MERRGRLELTREYMHLTAVTQCNHELTEGSSVTNQFEVSLS
jgi:hypothetical protein